METTIGEDCIQSPDDYKALYVPVAGPFITIGTAHAKGGGVAVLAIDGAAQTAGLALLIAGIVSNKKILLRNDVRGRDAGAEGNPDRRARIRGDRGHVLARIEPSRGGLEAAPRRGSMLRTDSRVRTKRQRLSGCGGRIHQVLFGARSSESRGMRILRSTTGFVAACILLGLGPFEGMVLLSMLADRARKPRGVAR